MTITFTARVTVFLGLKGIILKKFVLFNYFHSPNSTSHLNPVVLMLKHSSIRLSYETHGFEPYLSCYSFVTWGENVGQSYPELFIGS